MIFRQDPDFSMPILVPPPSPPEIKCDQVEQWLATAVLLYMFESHHNLTNENKAYSKRFQGDRRKWKLNKFSSKYLLHNTYAVLFIEPDFPLTRSFRDESFFALVLFETIQSFDSHFSRKNLRLTRSCTFGVLVVLLNTLVIRIGLVPAVLLI